MFQTKVEQPWNNPGTTWNSAANAKNIARNLFHFLRGLFHPCSTSKVEQLFEEKTPHRPHTPTQLTFIICVPLVPLLKKKKERYRGGKKNITERSLLKNAYPGPRGFFASKRWNRWNNPKN